MFARAEYMRAAGGLAMASRDPVGKRQQDDASFEWKPRLKSPGKDASRYGIVSEPSCKVKEVNTPENVFAAWNWALS